MITYVAAFATAVTLIITPVGGGAESGIHEKKAVEWTKASLGSRGPVSVENRIEISSVTPKVPYVLSGIEQRILHKALFRSIKITHPGTLA